MIEDIDIGLFVRYYNAQNGTTGSEVAMKFIPKAIDLVNALGMGLSATPLRSYSEMCLKEGVIKVTQWDIDDEEAKEKVTAELGKRVSEIFNNVVLSAFKSKNLVSDIMRAKEAIEKPQFYTYTDPRGNVIADGMGTRVRVDMNPLEEEELPSYDESKGWDFKDTDDDDEKEGTDNVPF